MKEEDTQEKSLTNVGTVRKNLLTQMTEQYMKEDTQEKNLTNVSTVRKNLLTQVV
ncbi:hypothetical protein [Cardinium endosymbiont of Dermatophagoides farinae]|uniref:hypothetical protein n=1 Tax=Cardinium endosymbiont of Dermatophagoides farinae TaxID=2597823 RepID=UPI00210776C0|nr:hypothetical protein [Cardinium endosymbiont of Dermatophagoides farinae]